MDYNSIESLEEVIKYLDQQNWNFAVQSSGFARDVSIALAQSLTTLEKIYIAYKK